MYECSFLSMAMQCVRFLRFLELKDEDEMHNLKEGRRQRGRRLKRKHENGARLKSFLNSINNMLWLYAKTLNQHIKPLNIKTYT